MNDDVNGVLQRKVGAKSGIWQRNYVENEKIFIVDKLCDEIRQARLDVLLHSTNEDQSSKHLLKLVKQAVFWFPNRTIHNALIANNLDHNKTLEQFLPSD